MIPKDMRRYTRIRALYRWRFKCMYIRSCVLGLGACDESVAVGMANTLDRMIANAD